MGNYTQSKLQKTTLQKQMETNALPNTSYDRGRSLPLGSTRFGPKFIIMPANCALTEKSEIGKKKNQPDKFKQTYAK